MEGRPTALTPRLRAVLDEIPALVLVLRGPDLVVEVANPRRRELTPGSEIVGLPAAQMLERVMADLEVRRGYLELLRGVLASGETVRLLESPVRFAGASEVSYWDLVVVPLRDDPAAPPDGVVLHAVDVTRLVAARQRAEEAEQRFTTLFAANAVGVTITDEEHLLEANDAFLAMIGRSRAELAAGLSWTALTAPESIAADRLAIASLVATGAAAPYEKEYLRADGSRVSVLISGSRVSASPLRVLATAFELTERKVVEREIAALLARTRRLQEITASVSASNSPGEIARAVIHHALEELSASAGVLVRGEEYLQLEHAIGFPPEVVEQWRAFPATLPRALRVADAGSEPAGAGLAGGSLTAVPLAIADRTLGSLGLAFREPRELGTADTDFLHALACQAAAALDRAQLYENRAYVARKLQEGLLPERLEDVPGLEAAVVYESISGIGEVGGDFYDLFATREDRWVVAVGDVCGKGTEAAVVTGLARHTLRAVARILDRPAEILEFLNGALRRHGALPAFCTVGCAVIAPDAERGGFEVHSSSGGHPFPLVLRADGALEEIEVIGTMLGVAEQPLLDEVALHLAPGDALILYTDGVTDARVHGGERFGEERMRAALLGAAGGSAAAVAQAVEAAVRAHHPGVSADDRAIVVLRAAPA